MTHDGVDPAVGPERTLPAVVGATTSPVPSRQPSASYSITMPVRQRQRPGAFARVAGAIGDTGAILGAIDLVRAERGDVVRDVTVACVDLAHGEAVVDAVGRLDGVVVERVSDRTFLMHLRGKIEVNATVPVKTRDDLSMAYTPGVARVSLAIHADTDKAWSLTIKGNTVAVISDGTAVLGLGDIGPEAAMPVMEGKALLFKEFAGVDAFPLCLATKDSDSIVEFVRWVAPTFGAINLEDISAPRCFEIERRLRAELDIPVFHDDQHGTAIVVLAALMNALRVVEKHAAEVKVVVVGAGAAGVACTEIMLAHGVRNVIVCDLNGALYAGRPDLDPVRMALAARTNPTGERGMADDVLAGADVLVGVSGPRRVQGSRRQDGSEAGGFRDGQSGARGGCGGGRRSGRDHGHRSLGLPESDQQRAGLPRCIPGRAGHPRQDNQRGDEARRRAGDRCSGHRRGAARRIHHPERVQP
jgi:malate dehydrogenase (oxaloacetate-decarboxylating)